MLHIMSAPPHTPVEAVTEVLHGVPVTDPYRWLEDQGSPRTREWIRAQTEFARTYLDSIPGRECIRARVRELLDVETYDSIQSVGERYFFRKRREEIELQLPDFSREIIPIELSDGSDYKKAEDDFISWMVTNRGLEAAQRAYRAEAITRMNVLKELAAAAKIDAVVDWIKDYLSSDQKLIVFTSHYDILDAVQEQIGGLVLHGGIPIDERERIIGDFRSWGSVLIANIQAAGLGLDLSMADDCVFLEMEWSPSVHDQAEARLVHHERRKPVTASYFIAKGTIEEQIYATLQKKRAIVSQVIDGVKYQGRTMVFDTEDVDVEMEVANDLVKERTE